MVVTAPVTACHGCYSKISKCITNTDTVRMSESGMQVKLKYKYPSIKCDIKLNDRFLDRVILEKSGDL